MAFDPDDAEQKAAVEQAAAAAKAAAEQAAAAARKPLEDELSALKTTLDGIDIEAVKVMLAKQDDEADKAAFKAGDIDSIVERRLSRERKGYEAALTDGEQQREALASQIEALRTRTLDAAIRSAAAEAGVATTALDDAVLRAGATFTVNEAGEVVAQPGSVAADGSALKLDKWLESLRTNAPHLFNTPAGANAGGNTSGRSTSGKKWADYSEAERVALFREDPDAFKRLKETKGA